MGFVSIYLATKAAESARESMKASEMTEEEIHAAESKVALTLVLIVFAFLVITILVYIVFNEEQFCFVHDIKQFFTDPVDYLEHNFRWLFK